MPKPKEILLFSGIYPFVAERLVTQLEDNPGDVVLRINSGGGDVYSGYSILAKMQEHKGKISIKVGGTAMSMAAAMLAFSDDVEVLDVSDIMIHRGDMKVDSSEEQEYLDGVNKTLRSKLESKINLDKLKAIKNVTMDEIFDPKNRLNVFLTGKEAVEIGLANKYVTLNAKTIDAFEDTFYKIAAEHTPDPKDEKILKPNKMTKDQLKRDHPELYAEIFGEGVAAEKDRVDSCLVFAEVDLPGVKAAIESGKNLTSKQMSEFSLKIMSAASLKKIEGENAPGVDTPEDTSTTPKSEKEKSLEAFEKLLDVNLNLNKK